MHLKPTEIDLDTNSIIFCFSQWNQFGLDQCGHHEIRRNEMECLLHIQLYSANAFLPHKNIVSKLANDCWPIWPSRWRKWIGHLHWFLFKFKFNFTLHTFRGNFSLIKCEQRSTDPRLLHALFDARGNHLLPIGIIHFNYLTLFNNTNCDIILIVELMAWH